MISKIKQFSKTHLPCSVLSFIILFFFLFFVRIFYLLYWESFLDSDESLVGIMAKHILEGKELPIYFYGQSYMGTLEQFSAALFFKLFGISPIVLKIVPLFFFVLSVILLYLIVEKYIFPKAYYIIGFMAFPPLFFIIWSMKARGGFMEVIFLSLLFLYLLFQYQQTNKKLTLYFLSFIAGFAIYTNALCIPFLLTVTIINYLDLNRKKSKNKILKLARTYFFSFLCLLIGLFPIFLHKITQDEGKIRIANFEIANFEQTINRAKIIVLETIPIVLGGVITKINSFSIYYIAEIILIIFNILAIIFIFYKNKKYFINLLCLKKQYYPKQIYFFIIIPIYLLANIFSQYSVFIPVHTEYNIYIPNVRYFLFYLIALPIILLDVFNFIKIRHKKFAFSLLFIIMAAGLTSATQLFAAQDNFKQTTATYKKFASDERYTNLIYFLITNNFKYGFVDYWDQWNINFLSHEKLKFASFNYGDVITNRYLPDYNEVMSRQKEAVYIFYEPKIKYDPPNSIKFTTQSNNNYGYKIIDDFVVFYPIN